MSTVPRLRHLLHRPGELDAREPEAMRPFEELLMRLPLLPVTVSGELDLGNCSPSLLRAVAEHADISASALNLGLSAVGQLIAHSSPAIEDGHVGADAVESLGWLIGELGVVAAYCQLLAAHCRRADTEEGGGLWRAV